MDYKHSMNSNIGFTPKQLYPRTHEDSLSKFTQPMYNSSTQKQTAMMALQNPKYGKVT